MTLQYEPIPDLQHTQMNNCTALYMQITFNLPSGYQIRSQLNCESSLECLAVFCPKMNEKSSICVERVHDVEEVNTNSEKLKSKLHNGLNLVREKLKSRIRLVQCLPRVSVFIIQQ